MKSLVFAHLLYFLVALHSEKDLVVDGRGLQDEPPGIQNHTPSGSARVVFDE